MKYKMRFYHKKGLSKGNLKKEEYFETLGEMDKRYREVFVYEDFTLNPTCWQLVNNEWHRILAYI